MRSKGQTDEEYYQKLAVLQTYVLDIVKAETFEELTKHVFAALDATIDPFFQVVAQVRFGSLQGFVKWKGEERRILSGEVDGMPLDGPGIMVRAVNNAREREFLGGALASGMALDGPGIMVRAVNTRKVCNVPDTRKDQSYLNTLVANDTDSDKHTLSEIASPIIVQGKSIGVINIEEVKTNAFIESDQKILEVISEYAGVSLNNILYSTRLNGLHKHTSQLSTLTSKKEVAEHTLDAMTDTLELETCSFLLLNQEGVLQTIYEKGLNESILYREKSRSMREHPERWPEGKNITFLSELETPVNVDDEIVAILSAKSIQPDKYTDQDKKLLEILASYVASAIQRIRLQEEREKVQQELALEHIRVEQANELDRMKNQFISTATHELRTPVTSIIGFLELVLDYSGEELPDSVRNDLNVVFRNAMRLVDMTNDLLDVQRITSGRFVVNLKHVELIKTLNEVVEELKPLFNDKHQTLLINAPSELMVDVDETRISQLLINLLRNANKFTLEKGTIEVKVEPKESFVQVSIKDSGIGLSEEDLGKLFKPFPGIHHGLDVSSTGLGLSIAKGIVDLHGGEIWAESDGSGMGSTFTFIIPLSS